MKQTLSCRCRALLLDPKDWKGWVDICNAWLVAQTQWSWHHFFLVKDKCCFYHFIFTHGGQVTSNQFFSSLPIPLNRESWQGRKTVSFILLSPRTASRSLSSRVVPVLLHSFLCNSVLAAPAVLVKQWPGAGRHISHSSPALGNREILSPVKTTYGLHPIAKLSARINWHDPYSFMDACRPALDDLRNYLSSRNWKLRCGC